MQSVRMASADKSYGVTASISPGRSRADVLSANTSKGNKRRAPKYSFPPKKPILSSKNNYHTTNVTKIVVKNQVEFGSDREGRDLRKIVRNRECRLKPDPK